MDNEVDLCYQKKEGKIVFLEQKNDNNVHLDKSHILYVSLG